MKSLPLERSYSLLVAEATLVKELEKLGYCYEFQFAGKLVVTCKCVIKDIKSGVNLASGNGKGDIDSSRVGSLFEAVEHLFSQYHFICPDKITYLNSSYYCQNNILCETLPLAIIKGNPNSDLPFLKYKSVNGSDYFFYPLALTTPSYVDILLENDALKKKDTFNYERLEHYSSNSGTAIGMNKEEAIIHGLLENIERTSLSKFLSQTFLQRKKKHLRLVNYITLPDSIREVLGSLERESGCKVYIFEMPNKFGIPAYCSWMEQNNFKIGFAGYGCSLSTEHAILRSLHELSQYFILGKHIYGVEWLNTIDKETLSQLQEFPLHQDCAKFNLGLKCGELGFKLINYEELASLQFSKNPKKYLKQLTDIIYTNGEIPFACELKVIGNGIIIINAFITGEDRFFTVRNGKSSFPITFE